MFIICYPEQTDQRDRSRLDWLALSSMSYFNPSELHWVFFSQGFMNHCWWSNAPGFDSRSNKRLFSSPLFPWGFNRSPCNEQIVLCAENSQAINSFLGVGNLGNSAANCYQNNCSIPTCPWKTDQANFGQLGISEFSSSARSFSTNTNFESKKVRHCPALLSNSRYLLFRKMIRSLDQRL